MSGRSNLNGWESVMPAEHVEHQRQVTRCLPVRLFRCCVSTIRFDHCSGGAALALPTICTFKSSPHSARHSLTASTHLHCTPLTEPPPLPPRSSRHAKNGWRPTPCQLRHGAAQHRRRAQLVRLPDVAARGLHAAAFAPAVDPVHLAAIAHDLDRLSGARPSAPAAARPPAAPGPVLRAGGCPGHRGPIGRRARPGALRAAHVAACAHDLLVV